MHSCTLARSGLTRAASISLMVHMQSFGGWSVWSLHGRIPALNLQAPKLLDSLVQVKTLDRHMYYRNTTWNSFTRDIETTALDSWSQALAMTPPQREVFFKRLYALGTPKASCANRLGCVRCANPVASWVWGRGVTGADGNCSKLRWCCSWYCLWAG